jgi:putative ABC transport system permease protein
MRLSEYQQHWPDDAITAIALRLIPEADPEKVAEKLIREIAEVQKLDIQPNRALRREALAVFDRTFLITGALRFLAILVAFIGILNALLSWQLEKQREAGILKALGLSNRQLWTLILTETGLMGTVAGLLAMPAGVTLAAILVYIINRRSFGWTMQLYFEPWPFFLAILIALSASLLAGAVPARKLSQIPPAEVLHYE